jgi:hypothetical protein
MTQGRFGVTTSPATHRAIASEPRPLHHCCSDFCYVLLASHYLDARRVEAGPATSCSFTSLHVGTLRFFYLPETLQCSIDQVHGNLCL